MRNLLTFATALTFAACTSGAGEFHDPPTLKVTSPQRSLVQAGAGAVTVTGTVTPNADGVAVDQVEVNGVPATVNPDGSFQATIQVREGATLIETVARDAEGGEAYDTRAVHAGELRTAGATVERALTASMSTDAFARISAAAGPMIQGMDLGAMVAPLQPMQHSGDSDGEDCLFERVFIDDIRMANISLSLVPQQGGIAFRAELDGLDVPGHVRYAVACVSGDNDIRVTADRVVVSGTLLVSPNGMQGFKTDLVDQNVELANLQLSASGIPGTILDMIDIESAIQPILAKGAELFMEPAMNSALGGLAGPQQLDVLGHPLTVQVAPSDISFDPSGALVTMDMTMLLGGGESSQFVFTANGLPAMDPGNGFQLGLADDLANQMMSQAAALGLLNLSMPAEGGTFDSTDISMTLPPMISADPRDGAMKVILGDMIVTYKSGSTPVGKAAVSAVLDLKIEPAANGYAVALKLGKPEIHFNVLDDIPNVTRLSDADLAKASEVCLEAQIGHITALLVNIPLPRLAGLQPRNLSVGADSGYVMVKGTLE
jgi:hypothetical protein